MFVSNLREQTKERAKCLRETERERAGMCVCVWCACVYISLRALDWSTVFVSPPAWGPVPQHTLCSSGDTMGSCATTLGSPECVCVYMGVSVHACVSARVCVLAGGAYYADWGDNHLTVSD